VNATYRILDEPSGGATNIAINPFWCLIAYMFGGAWLAALLFALNAWTLRGPTWRRETALAVAMLAGAPLLLLLLIYIQNASQLPTAALRYLALLIVAWKLALAYWIYFLQQPAYALHEYFEARRAEQQRRPLAIFVLAAGYIVRTAVSDAVDSPLWKVMVN